MTETLVGRERRFEELDHQLRECAYSYDELVSQDETSYTTQRADYEQEYQDHALHGVVARENTRKHR